MAIVDAHPRARAARGGGRSAGTGKRLDEMLATSERLFDESGSYMGLAGAARAPGLRPDRLREALQPPPRRPRLRARDGDEHLGEPDRQGARRALLRALHAGGRLDRALHGDHRPHPHHVRRDQVHGAERVGGQPGDRAGRHLRQQRPRDRRRPQRRRADLRADLRPDRRRAARARRVGGRGDPRSRYRRQDPRRGAVRADHPPRRRPRPPVHEDRTR